ncbi:MAG: hypothetical protein ABL904_18830, partial [Hyphomicrobiaceae bacterium]
MSILSLDKGVRLAVSLFVFAPSNRDGQGAARALTSIAVLATQLCMAANGYGNLTGARHVEG